MTNSSTIILNSVQGVFHLAEKKYLILCLISFYNQGSINSTSLGAGNILVSILYYIILYYIILYYIILYYIILYYIILYCILFYFISFYYHFIDPPHANSSVLYLDSPCILFAKIAKFVLLSLSYLLFDLTKTAALTLASHLEAPTSSQLLQLTFMTSSMPTVVHVS